jgi:AcrR family transcriptional regulator
MENIPSKRESNKEKKKASFIAAAEKLFLQKGFDHTSIDEVAKEAGLTKRTLYQYFISKEDLFFAITLRGARQLFSLFEEAMSRGNTVLEKISLGNSAYLKFYAEHHEMFRLLNYVPANKENNEASPHYREIQVLDGRRMKYFVDFVAAAKTDGSINPDLDMIKAVLYAFYTPFSLLYTVSSMNMWDRLPMDETEFLRFSFDLLINALK